MCRVNFLLLALLFFPFNVVWTTGNSLRPGKLGRVSRNVEKTFPRGWFTQREREREREVNVCDVGSREIVRCTTETRHYYV